MTAKFYDAKTGKFTRLINQPQSSINGDKYNIDSLTFFYYKVVLNYLDQTYKVFDLNKILPTRYGVTGNPIKWYEYVNPPQ